MAQTNYEHVKAWRKRNPDKVNAQAVRRRIKHPEKFAAVAKRYRTKHRDRLLPIEAEQARARRKSDPEGQKVRNARFKAKREAERVKIAGRPRPKLCELCGGNHHLGIVFDHCHSSGLFRGWICDRCNKVLGLVKDDPSLLKNMATYLEKASGEAEYKAKERSSG